MSQNNRVRVVGYAQRVFYGNGITYRNFSTNIVGNQSTQNPNGNSSVFTFGNFVTTTNNQGRASRIFSTNKFSNYYNLDTYKLLPSENKELLKNNINIKLNLDNSSLSNFVYFGSSTEFIRVTLEKIITDWPASLYLEPLRSDGINTIVGDTVSNYTYDPVLDKSTFEVDTNFINNKFNINYLKNGTIINTFNEKNSSRNLTVNFNKYVIVVEENEYELINFTGATNQYNDIIAIETSGDPFGFNGSTNSNSSYHIRPSSESVESFFNSLSDYETNLLNRLTVPIYTSNFEFKTEDENGTIILDEETLSWPVSDGYNIDYDTTEYINFVSKLLLITKNKDEIETNLMSRFLTAQAISDFDTLPSYNGNDEESAGQKMDRTLKIYGREFDEIKKYIDSISFANVVTYDKKKNTPDQLVKYLARVLGWELTTSIVENDLIKSYLKVGARSYAGHSRGLTPAESEIELWRRLILNSSWIWKSKGTRKAVEFFFKLIGTPDGLIDFDEYVYVAKEAIDMDLFYATLKNNNLDDDLSLYNVDSDGYPKFFRDTDNMYFQKGGQWYRETAGPNASQYILAGNNPHVGPYDGGKEYINQLENIIPSFTAFTLTSTTITTGTTKLFTNYNSGIINQYTGSTYVTLQNDNGINLTPSLGFTPFVNAASSIIKDPFPQIELTDCGCDVPEDDECLQIDIDISGDIAGYNTQLNCTSDLDFTTSYAINRFVGSFPDPLATGPAPLIFQMSPFRYNFGFLVYTYKLYETDGTTQAIGASGNNLFKYRKFIAPECCKIAGTGSPTKFYSYYHEEYKFNGTQTLINGTTGQLILGSSNNSIPVIPSSTNVTPCPTGTILNTTSNSTPTCNKVQELYDDTNLSWELLNCGYLCLIIQNSADKNINPVFPLNHSPNAAGGEILTSCSWILNGPTLSDMEYIVDSSGNGDYYLKFKKPNGDLTITSDIGPSIYPEQSKKFLCEHQKLYLNSGETILDPHTNKVGYCCKLTQDAKDEMNNNPTVTNSIYQTYLQRAIEKISCDDYLPIVV